MILNKEKLIKEQKFVTQLIVYSAFAIVGIGFFVLSIMIGENSLLPINLCMNVLISIIPFGYFMGLRRIFGVLKLWNKINNDDFTIVEMQIYDKQVFGNSKEARDTLLVFGEKKDNVFLHILERNKYKEGDICYRFYITNERGEKKYFALYNKRIYKLDGELYGLLDFSYVQPQLDERYMEKDV